MSATRDVSFEETLLPPLAEMGKRFSSAWNRAAAGEQVNETNVTFLDVQTMLDTLSPPPPGDAASCAPAWSRECA